MKKMILAMVDVNEQDGCPNTFCLNPSNELKDAVFEIRQSMRELGKRFQHMSSRWPDMLVSISWPDEGCWVKPSANLLTGQDLDAIMSDHSACEVTDLRLEVGMKSISFIALYEGEEITTHDIPFA